VPQGPDLTTIPARKTLFTAVFIFLAALALRVYQLGSIPPGLTHDEANHGREAIGILDGVLRYYFPLNYGSEPLYSYTVAAAMALLGENILALRLVNVVFGLAAIAVTALWARRAFDRPTALIAAALMAVSFWPIAGSREALRAGMLPFFMALAVWFYWQIIYPRLPDLPKSASWRRALPVLGFALSIVATFHIYLAARVAWLVFPAFLLYLALVHRPDFQRAWRPVSAGLLLTGLLLVPMFVYLANNPAAQTRLSMLDGTVGQTLAGNVRPLLGNVGAALLAFVWPGYGDQFLAYNIPGRPVLDGVTAVFFVAGIIISLWRWRQPAYAFLLLWFAFGIIPSLVTGPTANTTRNLAALPAVFLLPALGFVTLARLLAARTALLPRTVLTLGAAVWLLFVAISSANAYFIEWGQAPEVRSAYQHTLVEELAYLDQRQTGDAPVVISSVYPGPAHDPSIALVFSGDESNRLRWINARYALLQPAETAFALISAATPAHAAFAEALRPLDRVALRPDDLDPSFTFYELIASPSTMPEPLADFGGAVQLLDAEWLSPTVAPGATAELLTRWRVIDPALVGPVHFPTETTEAVLFTHVLDEAGQIISQRDALDAPSWGWQAGDIIWQVHELWIPEETEAGNYTAVVGIYDRVTGARLPVVNDTPPPGETTSLVPPLEVAKSAE
jgi:4-amino-4-deoxy-L-arabinose transferase-like glycosyltransferase